MGGAEGAGRALFHCRASSHEKTIRIRCREISLLIRPVSALREAHVLLDGNGGVDGWWFRSDHFSLTKIPDLGLGSK